MPIIHTSGSITRSDKWTKPLDTTDTTTRPLSPQKITCHLPTCEPSPPPTPTAPLTNEYFDYTCDVGQAPRLAPRLNSPRLSSLNHPSLTWPNILHILNFYIINNIQQKPTLPVLQTILPIFFFFNFFGPKDNR